MHEWEARDLASTINGDFYDWEAEAQNGVFGWHVVAVFEEGGRHVLHSSDEWEDVKALVYGEDDE